MKKGREGEAGQTPKGDACKFYMGLFSSLNKRGEVEEAPTDGEWKVYLRRVEVEDNIVRKVETPEGDLEANIKLSRFYKSDKIPELMMKMEPILGGSHGYGGKHSFYKKAGLLSLYNYKVGKQGVVKGEDVAKFLVIVSNLLGHEYGKSLLASLKEAGIYRERVKKTLVKGALTPLKRAVNIKRAFNLGWNLDRIVDGLGGLVGAYVGDGALNKEGKFVYTAKDREEVYRVAEYVFLVTGERPKIRLDERNGTWNLRSRAAGLLLEAMDFERGKKTVPRRPLPLEKVVEALRSGDPKERAASLRYLLKMKEAIIMGDGSITEDGRIEIAQNIWIINSRIEALKEGFNEFEELLSMMTGTGVKGEQDVKTALETLTKRKLAYKKPFTGTICYILRMDKLEEQSRMTKDDPQHGRLHEFFNYLKERCDRAENERLSQLAHVTEEFIKVMVEELGIPPLEIERKIKIYKMSNPQVSVSRRYGVTVSVTRSLEFGGWIPFMLLPVITGEKGKKLAEKIVSRICKVEVEVSKPKAKQLAELIKENIEALEKDRLITVKETKSGLRQEVEIPYHLRREILEIEGEAEEEFGDIMERFRRLSETVKKEGEHGVKTTKLKIGEADKDVYIATFLEAIDGFDIKPTPTRIIVKNPRTKEEKYFVIFTPDPAEFLAKARNVLKKLKGETRGGAQQYNSAI